MKLQVRFFCCCKARGGVIAGDGCMVGDALGKHSICWVLCFYSDTLVSVRLLIRSEHNSHSFSFLEDLYSCADDA